MANNTQPSESSTLSLICFATIVCIIISYLFNLYQSGKTQTKLSDEQEKRRKLYHIHALRFSPTDNKMGFSLPLFGPIDKALIDALNDQKTKTILEVAAGHGIFALSAMMKNPNLILDVNDLSENHLTDIRKKTNELNLKAKQLHFLPGDIFSRSLAPNHYDIVVIRHVMHFFDGDQIEKLLTKISETLKPGGKVYIVTGSPHTQRMRDTKFDQIINDKQAANEKWPGFLSNFRELVAEKNQELAEKLPNQMHLLHDTTLRKALENAGFTVEIATHFPAPKSEHPTWKQAKEMIELDGREYTGAIASKKATS